MESGIGHGETELETFKNQFLIVEYVSYFVSKNTITGKKSGQGCDIIRMTNEFHSNWKEMFMY